MDSAGDRREAISITPASQHELGTSYVRLSYSGRRGNLSGQLVESPGR